MLRSAARFCITPLLLTVWVACSTPTSPTDGADEEIAGLWEEGQQWLLILNEQWTAEGAPIRGDVRSVPYTRFLFVSHDEPLFLGGEPVGGFFEPSLRRIHYRESMIRGAIPHEACHAILYDLGDPRWRCVFHDECHP